MSGITEQAMTKLTGKDDWGTPKHVVDYIERNYALTKFEIDACASEHNHKCEKYITKEMNLFRHKLNKSFFMNPIYGKKGNRTFNKGTENEYTVFNQYGTEDFVKFAHEQHFKFNVVGALLLFANVSSSEYYQQYIGETPQDRKRNHCDLFMYPRRIAFEGSDGQPVGTPSLSSMVVVFDERFGN